MCKAPKAPKAPDPITPDDFPQAPTAVNPAALKARQQYAKMAALAKGHSSTILTGGRGLSEDSAVTAKASLLGGAGSPGLNTSPASQGTPKTTSPVEEPRSYGSFTPGLDRVRGGGSLFEGIKYGTPKSLMQSAQSSSPSSSTKKKLSPAFGKGIFTAFLKKKYGAQ